MSPAAWGRCLRRFGAPARFLDVVLARFLGDRLEPPSPLANRELAVCRTSPTRGLTRFLRAWDMLRPRIMSPARPTPARITGPFSSGMAILARDWKTLPSPWPLWYLAPA